MFVHICIPFLPAFLVLIFPYLTSNFFGLETDLVGLRGFSDNFRKKYFELQEINSKADLKHD